MQPPHEHGARVLHVVTDTDRRGAQVFANDLSRLMCHNGALSRTVALTAGGQGAQLDLTVMGGRARSGRTLRRLRREMRESDVTVAHGSKTLIACTLAGMGLGVPLVYRNISDPAYWLSTKARRLRVRLMLGRAAHIVALWPGGAEYLAAELGLSRNRITVIPNGVPVADFRPPTLSERQSARTRFGLPASAPVLVYAAALQPEKHPETAVQALAWLPEDTHLLMIGGGPLREQVAALAESTAPGRVVIAGQIDDPVRAFWAADLIVLPSEGEGLPAVLIESALCGLPGVVSSSGGNADIVRHDVTGFVVDPADPVALATYARRAFARRADMGRAADQHCRTLYDMDSVTTQWQSVIERVVASRNKQAVQ